MRKARKEGLPGFQIIEPAAPGKPATAGKRKEYFPRYFFEPDDDYQNGYNQIELGFDVASDPACREALERSSYTGEASATGRVTLGLKPGGDGFMIFVPLYKEDTADPAHTQKRRRRCSSALRRSSWSGK
jgi:CHASE1-domain containing sensor protein